MNAPIKKPTDEWAALGKVSGKPLEPSESSPPTPLRAKATNRSSAIDSDDLAVNLAKFQRSSSHSPQGEPPLRKGLKARVQLRGIPEEESLKALARIYLKTQRSEWPELVGTDWIPKEAPDSIDDLVARFRRAFQSRDVQPLESLRSQTIGQGRIGISYLRYSCEKQDATSLEDQLYLQLKRARADAVFIPWNRVYAGAGVSGTTNERVGYRLTKMALALEGPNAASTLYIDEISRATRFDVEVLQLGHLVRSLGKRMVGVSDGVDSSSESFKMQLHLHAMANEHWLQRHTERVKRGLMGSARRGLPTCAPPAGIIRVPVLDSVGRPIISENGKVLLCYAKDPRWEGILEQMARWFLDDLWPAMKIARELNRIRPADRSNFHTSTITSMFRNQCYIGRVIFNRTREVKDPITGRRRLFARPESEWIVQDHPHLRSWSDEQFAQMQRRLAEIRCASPASGKRRRVFPKMLLSGILFCASCGSEMTLFRSTPRSRQVFCAGAREGRHGCQMRGSKALRIVETALLSHVRDNVLTDDALNVVVERANAILSEEKSRPRADVAGLQRSLAACVKRQKRLAQFIGDSADQDLDAVRSELSSVSREIRDLEGRITAARTNDIAKASPLSHKTALALLEDIRSLLNRDVLVAGPALKRLLGKVYVHSQLVKGSCRPLWTAKVKSDLVPLLVSAAKARNCPESLLLETLQQRGWTTASTDQKPQIVEIEPKDPPLYRIVAQEIKRLTDSGATLRQAGIQTKVSWDTALRAYRYAVPNADAKRKRHSWSTKKK